MLFSIPIFSNLVQGDTLVFDFSQASINNGLFEFPIYLESDSDIFAFDFENQFDLDELTYDSYQVLDPSISVTVFYNAADSTLRGTSFSLSPYTSNQALVLLRFSFTNNPGIEDFKTLSIITNGSPAGAKYKESFCSSESVTLVAPDVNPSNTYVWSNGETASSINVNTAGFYNVQTNTPEGIVNSPIFEIETVAAPEAAVTPNGSIEICDGDNVILNANSGNFSYLWSSGQTSPTIAVNMAGTYSVEVTDNVTGCSTISTQNAVVSVNPLPDASITFDGVTSLCTGESTELFAVNDPDYSYNWSTGANTNSITVSQSGTYSLTVIDENSCFAVSDPIELEFVSLDEDFDSNGLVDVLDYLYILGVFGTNDSTGDLNNSGLVDVIDLLQVLGKLGATCTTN